MGPSAAYMSGGQRLHLQHGPIDLIIGADGHRAAAFEAARSRFETVLSELVDELPLLRARLRESTPLPKGEIAGQMFAAATPFQSTGYLTSMAAVAGSVAQTVLAAMTAQADLSRAYVNNGGDIAIHLTRGQRFKMAVLRHDGRKLGEIDVGHADPVRGIATSGRHGRSLSLGIADSVTVLAKNAATADVAATLIANAVDLPGHPAITRVPACMRDDASDLGSRLVVSGLGSLRRQEVSEALGSGQDLARNFQRQGLISGAFLALDDQTYTVGTTPMITSKGIPQHA